MKKITHGFEIDKPIQSAPDVIRLLALGNIAIYRVVRYAKLMALGDATDIANVYLPSGRSP